MSWQVTATTVKCDSVGDYTTILVYKDGTTKCTYHNRYGTAKDNKKKMKNCNIDDCPQIKEFSSWAFSH